MTKLDLVIFSSPQYQKNLLKHCIYSVESKLQHSVENRFIVAPERFHCPGFQVITDQELWQKFDPTFQYVKLYNDTWTRQQILKLNCCQISSDDFLVIDSDVVFLRPISVVEHHRYNFYMAKEQDDNYFKTIKYLLGIDRQTPPGDSFISDFMIFNGQLLKQLHRDIEQHRSQPWLAAVENILGNSLVRGCADNQEPLLSEYELYGHWLLNLQSVKINQLIEPVDYISRCDVTRRHTNLSPKNLLLALAIQRKNYYQCLTLV